MVLFSVFAVMLAAALWFILFNRLRRNKADPLYLLFFTVFYVYIIAVLYLTLYDFQVLVVLKTFEPNLILKGQLPGKNLNLVPLINLTSADLQVSLLNILMLMPFGFGLPFVAKRVHFRKAVLSGALFSFCIELSQLISGLVSKTAFRIADVNDIIFNTLGAAIGFGLFICFAHICLHLFNKKQNLSNHFLQYVIERYRSD
jgi:glycopeptide antibiotics resistance protein